jgi:hypothetical protein
MRIQKALVAAAAVLVGLVGTAGAGRANLLPAHTAYLTFSGPVALPGVTLGAGTYIFELADPDIAGVVSVRSRDRRQTYFMGFTIPVSRPQGMGTDRPVSFMESHAGVAPPIKAWYPRDEAMGHQFMWNTGR